MDFITVTVSTVFSSFVSFLYTIFARRFIPPYEYGIYSTCLLLQTYVAYVQCGVHNAYNRDYPQIIGTGNIDKAIKLKNTAFTFVVGVYILSSIIIGVVLGIIFICDKLSSEYFLGYLIVLVVLILNTISDFGMNTMRMNGGYNYTALVTVIKTMVGCTVGLIFIYNFGYYGLFLLPVISALVAISLYYKRVYKGIYFTIERNILRNSMITGLPLMIGSLIWTAVASVDKFVILGFMNTEALGVYSVAQLGFSLMVLIPQSISQVFYIKISTAYGKSGNKSELIYLCNRYTLINVVCTGAVCVIGYYMLPVFVRIVMPNYVDGIGAAQIMLVGICIYGSTMLYGNIFSVLRMNKDLLWTSWILCAFNVVFSIGLVLIVGKHIDNVALGTSASYAAYSVVIIFTLSHKFGIKSMNFVKTTWIPLAIMLIPSIAFYYLIDKIYISLVYALVYISLVTIVYWRKTKIDTI